MILGIGTDILQRRRIKLEIAKRVLSEQEIIVLNDFKKDERKLEYLAGRFSLKEAIIKAIGNTNIKIGMRDITILNDELGKPILVEPVIKNMKFHISLSHEVDYCVGMCIIENV